MTPVEAMKQDLMDLLYRTFVRPVVLSTISQEKPVSIFQKQSITKNPGVHRSTPYSKSGRQVIGGGGITHDPRAIPKHIREWNQQVEARKQQRKETK